jgi:hypothetical protein
MLMTKYAAKSFIGLEAVRDKPLIATINGVEMGSYDRPVLDLGHFGRFSLNKTNVTTLIRAYGEDSRDWLGCEIKLAVGEYTYDHETRRGVVIQPISPAKQKAESASFLPKNTGDGMDDEIPF